MLVEIIPHLHSAPIPGSNPGGGSDPSCGVSLTRVYTVIPLKEQTPQVGQNERAQGRNFSCYTWKNSIQCGGRPSFLFTHTKKSGARPRMRGRTLQIWRSTKGRSDPAIGAGDLRLHQGQNAGLTPQSEHCVNTVLK